MTATNASAAGVRRAPGLRSIAARTAGLSWSLVVATLGLYVAFTFPYQKRVILDNMRSEAQNVATSISQVTATAIITEDYSAAIDHCLKVVQESPTLRYVVITRNDGFSLVHTNEGWTQQQLDGDWLPATDRRTPHSGFQRNAVAAEEVFHYSYPFAYSGIEWGWIHIGLSLKKYGADLNSLYLRTGLLAVLCTLGALFASLYSARRMTLPIAELGRVTEQVAGGDLSARAEVRGGMELERLAGSFNRMTEGLQASRNDLLAAQEYTEDIIRSLNDTLVVTDVEGRIQTVNRAAERLLGYSGEELVGQLLGVVLVDEAVLPERSAPDRPSQPRHREQIYRAKDGREIPVLFSAAPIQGVEGSVRGFACVAVDITERKQVERELHDAKEAAEAANLAKSQFLANMSHEIRTPMNGVLGMTELLLGTDLTDRQQRYAQTAHSSAEKLLTVLNDILDLSRIEAGHLTLAPTVFDLETLVQDVVDLLAVSARGKGLGLSRAVDAGVPRSLRGDPVRLRQILVNLAGNAVKFTESGGVSIRVSSVPELPGVHQVRFDVADTGCGITEADLARLFHPFSQVDSTAARKHGGTGLGLAISRQLVELMGGELGVDSTPGRGSTFWFSVPLEPSAARPTAPAPVPDFEASVGPVSGCILLAEDNRVNRELAQEMLEALGNLVVSVEDGAQAVAAWAEKDFDLVLMDCQMPRMDGYAATREIRRREARENRARVPIVALTAHAMQGDREQCLEAGMDDYLAKPFRQTHLEALLRRHLRPRKLPAAPERPAGYGSLAPPTTPFFGRILLAEDDRVNRKLAQELLEDLGAEVVAAGDGMAAVAAWAEGGFDLLLLDCQMPKMDGFEAAREIRTREEREGRQRVPIVALTGHDTPENRAQCLAAGMDEFLPKPFRLAHLEKLLGRHLAPRPCAPAGDEKPDEKSHPGASFPQGDPIDDEAFADLRAIERSGRGGVVRRIISMFLEDAPACLRALQEAAAAGDPVSLWQSAHSLKTISANLGARALAERCRCVEQAGRTGRNNGVEDDMAALTAEYERVRAALQARLAAEDTEPTPSQPSC
jgi:PAS domain S-box-containing protein